ncbi:MAG: uroporphyrinogen-III synthase [Planctomycetota bacterium]
MSVTVQRPVLCSLESRRAEEMCSLIERQGGTALSAPSMREIPIEHNPVAIGIINDLIAGRFPAIILLTGVGTEALIEVARSQQKDLALLEALAKTTIMIRGPKPAAVLSRLGLKYAVRAPEPNTWRELLEAIDASNISLNGVEVVVQEYGLPNNRFYDALKDRGAIVTACPVYRWALPENLEPLRHALRSVLQGEVDVLLFTSANQVNSVMTVATDLGFLASLKTALQTRTRIASIGPTCTEALVDHGFTVHAEASPPKMGQLVRAALDLCSSATN